MKFPQKKAILASLTAGVLALSLAACTGGDKKANPTPTVKPTPLVKIDSVKGQTTQVILASSFVAGLKKLKVTPSASGTATLGKVGTLGKVKGGTAFIFPITGGNVSYYNPKQLQNLPQGYVQGQLLHSGSGIELKAGRTVVDLRDFVVIPNSGSRVIGDVYVNDKSVANDVELFRLAGSTLQPLTQDGAGNAVLQGSGVYIAAPAAKLLDSTFKTKALTTNTKVGVARVTLALPKANGGSPSPSPTKSKKK